MNEEQQYQDLKGLDLVFDCVQTKIQSQSEQWNSIDNKNSIVIAIYGIILAIFLTSGISDVFGEHKKMFLFTWLLIITVGMACNLISLFPKPIDIPPKIDTLIDKYLNEEVSRTKAVMLSTMRESISENEDKIKKKTAQMSFSINICLPIALLFSVSAVFLNIMKG